MAYYQHGTSVTKAIDSAWRIPVIFFTIAATYNVLGILLGLLLHFLRWLF